MTEFNERRRTQWSQDVRKKNLEFTVNMIKQYGGYSKILNDMHDFERPLAFDIGCSIKTARDYIETVRGAALFRKKTLDSEREILAIEKS